MSAYVDSIRKAPKTLTEHEQRALLAVSGRYRGSFRDHAIFAVALGTGLREHEIIALDVGDVRRTGSIRRRFPLRVFKRSNQDPGAQEAILPDTLRLKLDRLLQWKTFEGEPTEDTDPLFVSRHRGRLSTRQLRRIFAEWQKQAHFERRFTFHSLRHTALTNLYRATKDIRLVQKIARHASIESTTIYTLPTDEDVLHAVRTLPC
jgi:integrase/recombinase XerC